MELTPQSRSPTSPFRYTSNPQPLYEYPSPARSDSRYASTDSLQGLGLYSCPLSGSNSEIDGTVMDGQSPPATNNSNRNWPTSGVQHRDTPRTSHSTPNILSAEYDPFAPFQPAVSSAFSHDIYSAQTAEVTILPASPVLSSNTSQRSSFSSAPASEIFTQGGSIHSYTPRIKMEDHTDYVTGSEAMLMSSPQLSHNLLVTTGSSYPGSLDAAFYPEPSSMGWSKMEYGPPDLPSISSLPIPQYDRRSESRERAGSGSKSRNSSMVPRTRQPRRLTTKEDANFQCHVKGCEKFFGRSYNFKAHMETHDAGREYPFPCPLKDCNKKFVRKTDLQRHHQSVHMKQRNHRCDYCSRFFARKDTLRRHMEDGCSKRFDIETVDFRPQSYGNEQNSMRLPSHSRPSGSSSNRASYSSSMHYSHSPPPGSSSTQASHDGTLTSSSGTYLERQDYLAGEASGEPVWSN